jgi:hypothetical protein
MADLLLKRRPYTDANSNPSPPSNLTHEAYPSPQPYRFKPRVRPQKPKQPRGYHNPFTKEDEDDETDAVRRAARLLLSKAWPSLSLDLCECCSASLNSRLVSMASSSSSSSPSFSKSFGAAKGSERDWNSLGNLKYIQSVYYLFLQFLEREREYCYLQAKAICLIFIAKFG